MGRTPPARIQAPLSPRRRRRAAWLVLAGLAGLLVPAACRDGSSTSDARAARANPASPPTSEPSGRATVELVIDGDTIDVMIGGREERVRLIGIDTPETRIPNQAPECWGPEASQLTKSLLPVGTPVRLERDVEPRDDFGRLLAYVIRTADELVINLELVRQGAAEPLRIRPNVAMAAPIAAAAAEARAAGRGLWGACPR